MKMADFAKVERMFKDIKEEMSELNEKMGSIFQEIKAMKTENELLKTKVTKQEERIIDLEREVRKKNIIIKGVEDKENEKETETREKIKRVLKKIEVGCDTDADLEEVRRLGRYKEGKIRPILIKVTRENTRTNIFKNAKLLHGTNVWINQDYPKTIQEERKILVEQMKEARRQGYRASIKYNKLIVDKETRKVELGGGTKRSILERSPEGNSLEEQFRKITRTERQKN